MLKKNFFLLSFLIFFFKGHLQTLAVGDSFSESLMRSQQMSGSKDDRSFIIRPLGNTANYSTDSLYPSLKQSQSLGTHFSFIKIKGKIKASSLDWNQEYNSDHPYGWNDGSMIPAKGYQTMFSTGFYADWGPISIQFKPEAVWSQNKTFNGFPKQQNTAVWASYFAGTLNWVDAPERFGNGSYTKLLPGQSSIRFNIKKISFGVSTENMWWGPGIRNSILMSNSAPGFLHFTINTISPIHTGIGSFEAQLVGGTLQSSGFLPVDTSGIHNVSSLYAPKINDTRYFNGFIISWQPKWVKNLYLGFAASVYKYTESLKYSTGLSKYLPVFHGFFRGGNTSFADSSDSYSAFYFRWVFPKAKAEIYFEWARNDGAVGLRDLLLSPEHSRAFIIGAKKIIELNKSNRSIELFAEGTHLELPIDNITQRADPTFYVHNLVTQGYTNLGQYIGAGIGPGSNCQSFDISYINGINKFGLMLEKLDHDMDFYNQTFSTTLNITRPWSDISATIHGDWHYKQFLFSASIAYIYSANYEWWKISGTNYVPGGQDVTNIHGQLSFSYRL